MTSPRRPSAAHAEYPADATPKAIPTNDQLLRHRLLDQTDDDHDDRAAHSSAGDLPYDCPEIEPSAGGCAPDCGNKRAEYLPADAAADNADDGVPDGTETEVLEQPSCDVSADRAADELDDQ